MVDDKVKAILLPYLEKDLKELNKILGEIEELMVHKQEKRNELSEQAYTYRNAIKKLRHLLILVKGTKN